MRLVLSRRVLAVTAAAAVAVALWLVVLVDFPSFHGNPHLPVLGPSPGALASPGPPSGEASNPQAQAGLPRRGTRLTRGGRGGSDVEGGPPGGAEQTPLPPRP